MWGNCEVFGYSWSVARTVGFAGRGPWEDERDSVVKQARAELTRQQIVAGAAAQFEKTGYGSTSMADIVSGGRYYQGRVVFPFRVEGRARAIHHCRTASALDRVGCRRFPRRARTRWNR